MSIYTFKSKAGGPVMMLQHHAEPLFKIMGISLNPQGAIEPENIPMALQKLSDAITDEAIQLMETEESKQHQPAKDANTSPSDNDSKEQEIDLTVSLRQRAYPLQKLLQQAETSQQQVYWGF